MLPLKKIRVLQLGSPTGLYGAERWILALVKYLPPDQIETIVGVVKDAPGNDPALCREAAVLGMKTLVVESHGRLSLSAIPKLRQFILDKGIDVLHAHGYKSDILGFLATRGTKCKVISTPHGWSVDAGLKLQAYEAFDRFIFRFLDAVVPLSSDLYDGLSGAHGLHGRLRFIANGVDRSEVDAVTMSSPDLAALKENGSFVVGYIGQLIPRKGIDTLLRAFSLLESPGKKLCIVGEGPQQLELEHLAKTLGVADNVYFFGYREDRLSMLKGFDVFVLPSKLEGIPRCLLEAMAAGVAVIASDIPGCRALIESESTGLLYRVDDAAGFACGLELLLSDARLRFAIGDAGQKMVRKKFSAEVMASHYSALYKEITVG